MAHFPKPFFKKGRGVWYVEIDRKQHNLGSDREEAFRRYHLLMAQPQQRRAVSPESLAAIIDAFLEWVSKHRSPETYEWYRYRLQRFVDRHPALRAVDLRPFHVETWADSYQLSVTSRRNYLRSVKRCLKWAKKQGYIGSNPIADLEGRRRSAIVRVGRSRTLDQAGLMCSRMTSRKKRSNAVEANPSRPRATVY